MYKNGEIERVMDDFEKSLRTMSIYTGGTTDKADRQEVVLENGRTSMRYTRNNYYNNGNVNQLFLMYLSGYASGKLEGRNE